jgi:peroxiredoxin
VEIVLGVAVVVLVVGMVLTWGLVFQLLRQQGRILVRLDELAEPDVGGGGVSRPSGVAVGVGLPKFVLRDLDGAEWSSAALLGERALVMHWDPLCGYCREVAPDLVALRPGFEKARTRLVLVSHRDAEMNRQLLEEYPIQATVLLHDSLESIPAFARMGTPAAYLLDPKGRVAKPVAVGADEVVVLAAEAGGRRRLGAQKSLSESRLLRTGLAPGTPAPEFAASDLDGRLVTLSDYRGERVLLVFSDPTCGPCDALARELAGLEANSSPAMRVVIISRGSIEENRLKATEHGLRFPVVIQQGWSISKLYGIFETPVGFLIDGEGVIERPVARGVEEVLELADVSSVASGGVVTPSQG